MPSGWPFRPSRRLFLDVRHRVGPARAARRALLVVPLGVVVLEEVAFRGVLWGLLEVEHGAAWATAVSSVLFGRVARAPRRRRGSRQQRPR